jgi:DNA-nicking Smr family endonuclease
MWPFKSKKAPEDTTERFERVEKAMRRLEEEWSDVYHKFRVLQMRVAKQVQRIDANSSREEPQGAGSDGAAANPASSLSPRMQRIQEEILRRRRRGGPGGNPEDQAVNNKGGE